MSVHLWSILGHSCNKMKINGKIFLVVAGGHEGHEMITNYSVELTGHYISS